MEVFMDNTDKAEALANKSLKRSHPFVFSSHRGSTMTNRMDFNRTNTGRQLGPSGANYFRSSRLKKAFSLKEYKEDHQKIIDAMKRQISGEKTQ